MVRILGQSPILAALPLALALSGAPGTAQIGITKKRPAARPAIADLIQQLADDDTWWDARQALIERARDERLAVLAPLGARARTGKDTAVGRRCKLVTDAIVREYVDSHKSRERRERMQAVVDALDDLKAASPAKSKDELRGLERAIGALEKSIATDEPIDLPPLKVPVGGPPAEAPRPQQPAGGFGGYRRIKVGDKDVLVPASDLPEGTEYHAEFLDGGLHIRRFKSKEDKERFLKLLRERGKENDQGGEEGGKKKKKEKAPPRRTKVRTP